MRTPTRQDYQNVLSRKACLNPEYVELATAIQRAHTPSYTVNLEASPGQPYLEQIQSEVNLWVVCGAPGVLEFQLIGEGGSDFTSMQVVAGQKVEGHFFRIGPNTTCFPLIGFGNLP